MQPRRMERVHEDRDGGVKLKIPPYSENKKMRLAIAEFTNHAGDWYQHLKSERRRIEEVPIETWEELKEVMRIRYVLY